MKNLIVSVLFVSAGCFNPDLSSFTYRCSSNTSMCPTGYSCISGICQLGAGDVGDMSMDVVDLASATDQAGSPPSDLSGQPSGGPSTVAGCANPGYRVGLAFACPGTFDGSKADVNAATARCATGYQLCTSSLLLDQAACNALPGFFVAAVPGSRSSLAVPESASCAAPAAPGEQGLWFGCGQLRLSRAVITQKPCTGFQRALDCINEANWTCDTRTLPGAKYTLEFAVNKNANDGVLCCR